MQKRAVDTQSMKMTVCWSYNQKKRTLKQKGRKIEFSLYLVMETLRRHGFMAFILFLSIRMALKTAGNNLQRAVFLPVLR